MVERNPFTPSFGVSPPLLVGRDQDLEDFRAGLLDGPGSLERVTLVTGMRGTGKTVMLNEYEDIALREGWLSLSETATSGMLDRLTKTALPQLLREHDPRQTRSRVTSASIAGAGSLNRDVVELHHVEPSLRSQLQRLLEVLPADSGVLITVDEVHHNDEVRQLGATLQHLRRENRNVAFAGAGLPSRVSEVLASNEPVLTFLRRADRRHLGAVDEAEVGRALQIPFQQAGRTLSAAALDAAVAGTRGYPFMIQLVGQEIWRAGRKSLAIDLEAAQAGIATAQRKVGQLVHVSALAELSTLDRSFLVAMAHDDGPSKMADIASRLGVDANYASQYRLRLIAAELIDATGHGRVDFAVPYLREYLREHAATLSRPTFLLGDHGA